MTNGTPGFYPKFILDRQADALISGVDLDNLDDFSDSYEQYVKIESSSDFAKSFLQTVS